MRHGALYSLVIGGSVMLGSIVGQSLLARSMAPSEYGLLLLIISGISLGGVLFSLGSGFHATLQVSASLQSKSYLRLASETASVIGTAAVGLGAACVVAVIFAVLSLVRHDLGVGIWLAIAVGIATALRVVQHVTSGILRGFHDYVGSSVSDGMGLGSAALLAVVSIVAIAVGATVSALDITFVLCLGSVVMCGVAICRCRDMYRRLGANGIRRTPVSYRNTIGGVRASLKVLGLVGLRPFLLWNLDLLILAAVADKVDVARYGVGVRIVIAVEALCALIQTPLLGIASAEVAGSKVEGRSLEGTFRQNALRVTFVGLASLAIVVLCGDRIVLLVFGHNYGASVTPMVVLMIGEVVNLGTGSAGILMTVFGETRLLTIVSVMLLLSKIAGLLGGFLWFGLPGAAIGSSLSVACQNIVVATCSMRLLNVKTYANVPSLRVIGAIRNSVL